MRDLNTRNRNKMITAFMAAILVVVLFGGVVSANGMPGPNVYLKVTGNPDNDKWFMEVLTDQEPIDKSDPVYFDPNSASDPDEGITDEERIEQLVNAYGEDVVEALGVFDEYAASEGLNCTLMVSSNYTLRNGLTEKAVIELGDPHFGFIGSDVYTHVANYRFAFYFPESGETVITEPVGDKISESRRFVVDLSERTEGTELSLTIPNPHFYRTWDLVSRMVFTIVVETLVAIVGFKVRNKRFLLYIAIVNLFSNGIFNLLTSRYDRVGWGSYIDGPMFLFQMFVGEIIVFFVEAVIWTQYHNIFGHAGFYKTWENWAYSFFANSISAFGSLFIFFYFDALIW